MVTATASDAEKLKKKLRKRVNQALDEVCGEYAREQQQRTSLQQSDVSVDRSYGSCKTLVAYISDNMATSPGFVEQMDRVILACFSGASKRVLSTVATQEVWFRAVAQDQQLPPQHQQEGEPPRGRSRKGPRGLEKPTARKTTASAAVDEPVIKQERVEVSTIGARGDTLADGAGLESREVAGSVLAKRPRSRTSKKKLSTKKPLQALMVAEPKAAQRRVDTVSSAESVEPGADTETDEEKEERKRPKKKPTPQKNAAVPVEDEQGLLTFKEAIGGLCYQEHRTLKQTEFFKERLRKSIQFVDALLCRPPPGKVCTRTCSKIRGSMCNSPVPCEDQMCRIWHDVEAHTDRCKNLKCEFKLRILVRETMHKLHTKQLEIKNASLKLRKKNAALDDLNATELSEPGTFADAIATLESEIEKLEQGLVDEETEMAQINGTLEKYWAILNEIGIESRHDKIDKFPEFVTHYAIKKKRK